MLGLVRTIYELMAASVVLLDLLCNNGDGDVVR